MSLLTGGRVTVEPTSHIGSSTEECRVRSPFHFAAALFHAMDTRTMLTKIEIMRKTARQAQLSLDLPEERQFVDDIFHVGPA